MNETNDINCCARAEELIAYVYAEATLAERENFKMHTAQCATCRDELAAFGEVREAVGLWHREILDSAPALSLAGTMPSAAAQPQRTVAALQTNGAESRINEAESRGVVASKRSAREAFREFFALSPLWLRVGALAATLIVCALAALAVVNAELRWNDEGVAFNTRLPLRGESLPASPALVEATQGKVYSQAEVGQLVAEREAALRELEDARAQLDDSRTANLIAASETLEPVRVEREIFTPNNARRARRSASAPTDNSPSRLRDERDEEDTPRLYDLLTEAN